MKKSVKILTTLMAFILIFACGIGATLAYLQKTTGPVVNTFASRDLIDNDNDFVLKEHDVTYDPATGTHKLDAAEVNGVKYENVTPGETLPKDPFVRVNNKANAYLFIEVKNDLAAGMTYEMDPSWVKVDQAIGQNSGEIFVKKVAAVGAKDEYVLPAREAVATFKILNPEKIDVSGTEFKPETVNNDGSVKLSFWAYLTQADGFANYQESWNATFGK